MSKLAVLPNVQATPEIVLSLVQEQFPLKSVYIVTENIKGEWYAYHSVCSAAELCLAGAFLQRKALDTAINAAEGDE